MKDTKPVVRVGIYARISVDQRLEGIGVGRQLEDCRKLCERNGFVIIEEYVDNDRSAYSETAKRPAYDRLLDDVRAHRIDAIVAYKDDRLGRRLRTLIDLYDLLKQHHVVIHLVSGSVDLQTPQGIAMAQVAAVMAENYVSTARENNLRSRRQIAEAGKRHCSRRPYGWEPGGLVIRTHEAEVVREVVSRTIAGETPTSIAMELNSRDIPTVEGRRWTGIGVRKCAARASNAAIREHNGKLYYNGQWEPIISQEEYAQVLAAINRRGSMKYKRGIGRKYLLTGFVYCGNCGNRLSATVGSSRAKPAYRCHKNLSNDPSPKGCGKVSRNIEALELLIKMAVLERLNSPALLKAIGERSGNDEELSALVEQRDQQSRRIEDLVNDYATGTLTSNQFKQAKKIAENRLGEITYAINRATVNTDLAGIDLGSNLAEAWASGSLTWRHNLVELLVERIEVMPYVASINRVWWQGFRFDPDLVKVIWRV